MADLKKAWYFRFFRGLPQEKEEQLVVEGGIEKRKEAMRVAKEIWDKEPGRKICPILIWEEELPFDPVE
ncbi:MAG: hypothetical protein NTX82_03400 [Candidatus Parcubacteria bacterium]|nr:hypothetical protein [Candidatus Parcubacteria bacterium]